MTRYVAVTTCSAAGWRQYGARMVESFCKEWVGIGRLVFYAEDFEPTIAGVDVRPLPLWLQQFKQRQKDNQDAHGLSRGRRYDFRRDCVKFAHKTAATIDAAERMTDGILIWMDADIVTHQRVTDGWLAALFPDPSYIAWLDRSRIRRAPLYPECGFVMYRTNHRSHAEVMRRWRALYETDEILLMKETHDSFVLWKVIEAAANEGLIEKPISLSGNANDRHHPFVAGPLGERMDHLKGARKKMGRSYRTDFVRREGEYWR